MFDTTKKRVISARNASHMEWGVHERAVDRVTAFALSSSGRERLGGLLWRIKYGREHGWRDLVKPVMLLLEKQFRDPSDKRRPVMLRAILACALVEWVGDQCRKCGGRGKLGAGREVAVTVYSRCRTCGGKGRVFHDSSYAALFRLHGALAGSEVPWPHETQRERDCSDCRGKGGGTSTTTRYSRLRACVTCRGSGRLQMGDERRSLELGLSMKNLAKWKPIYQAVMRELRAADAELAMRIDFRLERAENPDPEIHDPVEPEQAETEAPESASEKGSSDLVGELPPKES